MVDQTMQDIVNRLFGGLDASAFGEVPYFLCTEQVRAPRGFEKKWAYLNDEESVSSHPWLNDACAAKVPAIVIVSRMPSEKPRLVSVMIASHGSARTATMPPIFLLPVGDTCALPPPSSPINCAMRLLHSECVDDVIWGSPAGFALVLAFKAKQSSLHRKIWQLRDQLLKQTADNAIVEAKLSALNVIRWQYLPSRLLHSIPRARGDLRDNRSHIAGFRIGPKITRGLFGTLHIAATDQGEMRTCSMLVVDKDQNTFSFLGMKMLNHHLRLMQDLNRTRHPNLAHLMQVYHTPKRLCVATEISGTKTLYSRLKMRDKPAREIDGRDPLSPATLLAIMKQMVSAAAHLHSIHFCHRDIKPENLTINDQEGNVEVKLGGFELARMQMHDQLCSSSCGTMPFAAPEMIIEKAYNGLSADMWSVGVVFVELTCGLRLIERVLTRKYGAAVPSESEGRNIEAYRKAAHKIRLAFADEGTIEHLFAHSVPEAQHMRPWLVPYLTGLLKVDASERLTSATLASELHAM